MKRIEWGLLGALSALSLVLYLVPFTHSLEWRMVDGFFHLRGARQVQNPVVVVAIDEKTLQEAWNKVPRSFWASEIAKILQRLREAEVSVVGLDMVIAVEADEFLRQYGVDLAPNEALIEAILDFVNEDRPLYIGTKTGNDVANSILTTLPPDWLVSLNLPPDEGEIIRRVPRKDSWFDPPLPSLCAKLAKEPPARQDPFYLNYSGAEVLQYSAIDVIEERVSPSKLKGKIVLIGETYPDCGDLHSTPYSLATPGVVVQAEAVQTLLDKAELRPLHWIGGAILIALLTLGLTRLALSKSPLAYFLTAGVGSAVWVFGSYLAFAHWYIVIPTVLPVGIALLIVPGSVFPMVALKEKEERLWTRTMWGQMIPEGFLERIEKEERSGALGDRGQFEAVLMCLDINGFSEMVNRLEKQKRDGQAVEYLNTLFQMVIEEVHRHEGGVLNLVGDGLIAMFEINDTKPRDAMLSNALSCALSILGRLEELDWQRKFDTESLQVRMGLAYGRVTLAIVGAENRKQMTVYGSALNLASRLEQACKQMETPLILSEHFEWLVNNDKDHFERVELHIRGWQELHLTAFMLLPEGNLSHAKGVYSWRRVSYD